MERVQPITSLKEYHKLSAWGMVYDKHFVTDPTQRDEPTVTAQRLRLDGTTVGVHFHDERNLRLEAYFTLRN